MGANLGSELRKRRSKLNLTQEDLAELSNISVNFLSQLERTNNQNISIKKIESIATALNTSTPELISAAYKNQPDNIENNKSKFYFLDKLNIAIKKLPQKEAEEVSKHLFYVINDLTK